MFCMHGYNFPRASLILTLPPPRETRGRIMWLQILGHSFRKLTCENIDASQTRSFPLRSSGLADINLSGYAALIRYRFNSWGDCGSRKNKDIWGFWLNYSSLELIFFGIVWHCVLKWQPENYLMKNKRTFVSHISCTRLLNVLHNTEEAFTHKTAHFQNQSRGNSC